MKFQTSFLILLEGGFSDFSAFSFFDRSTLLGLAVGVGVGVGVDGRGAGGFLLLLVLRLESSPSDSA